VLVVVPPGAAPTRSLIGLLEEPWARVACVASNYASLTNEMCPRFNLSADFATIEELAKERRTDLDDACRQPAKAAGADPPVC